MPENPSEHAGKKVIRMEKTAKLISGLALALMLLNFLAAVHAAGDSNSIDSNSVFVLSSAGKQAEKKLQELDQDIQKMEFLKINTQRVNDLYLVAREYFNVQVDAEKSNASPDYSVALGKVNDAKKIVNMAFQTKNELVLLDESIKEAAAKKTDLNAVNSVVRQAKAEFKNERFELSMQYISEAHNMLLEQDSLQARSAAFYNMTQKTIGGFLEANWQVISGAALALLIGFLLLRKKIHKFQLSRQLEASKKEANAIEELMKQTQRQYFEGSEMSEAMYNVRTELFTTKFRDASRKIAILREEIAIMDVAKGINTKKPK